MIKFMTDKIEAFNGMLLVKYPSNLSSGALQALTQGGKSLRVQIDAPKKKRSLQANSYCWLLCQEIAEELSKNGPVITREDVYRKNIKDLFTPKFQPVLTKDLDWWLEGWRARGTGWLAEKVRPSRVEGFTVVAFWVGSSVFDTQQMSRLIEGLKQDAESLGISVMNDSDIALMLSNWKPEKRL